MSIVLGCVLGAGLLLIASPFLWPIGQTTASSDGSTATGSPNHLGRRVIAAANSKLAQAGLGRVSPAAVGSVSLVLGVAASSLAEAIVGVRVLSLIAGGAALAVPTLLVGWRGRMRRRANRTVWPDVVDHLVSAVRSGLALPDSVSSLAHVGPIATRGSFARFELEYRATGNFGQCVDTLKSDLADPTADRIMETLRMAREVGGTDLVVVLRSLAGWLRQDTAIRMEVEARQSWILNAARLGVAAPWIILVLLNTRPEAALAYNRPAGMAVILGGLVVSVLAYRIMVRLGRLPEERRWFQ
ncbi:type II secretion system F family protein [Glaciibacter psychrotolerans]|uniref:Tight adherence protein B n=1 Tax=Glaciibacter psychrotolerans TaxID=670054 RepID=A0A7Z0J5M0_9MICO|nr:type II secretion system F family protein [Leifsonia psychrotolerans]NYJ19627.1 tight adherence protein B [Leifsonia psychrotolerans]